MEDNSIGICAADKRELFTNCCGKNSGLGLFFIHEILATMGITITEDSEPGKGARFEITVPEGAWRFVKKEQ